MALPNRRHVIRHGAQSVVASRSTGRSGKRGAKQLHDGVAAHKIADPHIGDDEDGTVASIGDRDRASLDYMNY